MKKSESKEQRVAEFSTQKSQILFIWNTYPYSMSLADTFGRQSLALSEKEVADIDISNCSFIVILAELDWNGKKLSDFYGVEILKKLRAERHMTAQVLFCSFLPEEYFYLPTHHGRFDILKTSGHHFCQLPADLKTTLSKLNMEPIDIETLEDIVDSTCGLKGLLFERIHDLKNSVMISEQHQAMPLEKFNQMITDAVETAKGKISSLFFDDTGVLRVFSEIVKEINSKVKSEQDYSSVTDIISNSEGRLQVLLPSQEQKTVSSLTGERPPWKILFVDDKEVSRQRIREEFEKRNITCEIACTAEEVFKILDDDVGRNLITALIVDYRLLTPDGRWQDMQGYSIIRNVHSNKSNFLAYFGLTFANREALLRIQSRYQIRVVQCSKEDLTSPGTFNMFERIKEEAEKTYKAVCGLPTLGAWHKKARKNVKPLKMYYRVHRASVDYEDAEREIDEKSLGYLNLIEKYEDSPEVPSVSGNYEFQSELDEDVDSPESIRIFRERLIGRRIAIGLYVKLGFPRKKIFYAMQKNPQLNLDDIPVEDRISEASVSALLSTALAFSIDDIPDHLLIEEYQWYHRILNPHIDVLITRLYKSLSNLFTVFQDQLKSNAIDPDPFAGISISVNNFKTAKETVRLGFEAAKRNEMVTFLTEQLLGLYRDQKFSEALRFSGIKSLLERHGVGKSNDIESGTLYKLGVNEPDDDPS
ncbi:MAG TPA: hypothetical protein VLX91_05895 [Candidatus Acidoferrales bacterium]|nr:hypothetical protein [Candidatus Acidoferrales bacterium]